MARPEILFPLFAKVQTLEGIGPKLAQNLEKAGLSRLRDLVFHLPVGGIDRRLRSSVKEVASGLTGSFRVHIGAHLAGRTKTAPYRVNVGDEAGVQFQLVFFHANKAWLENQLPEGEMRIVSGKVEHFENKVQIVHPDHMLTEEAFLTLPLYEALYPLTAGITQKTMGKAVKGAVLHCPDLDEWINPSVLKEKAWPSWKAAIHEAHNPKEALDVSPHTSARERLAYDELMAHQLTLAIARARIRRKKGVPVIGTEVLQNQLRAALPYKLTGAQERSIDEIKKDLAEPLRMNRLLQGDVGAGKTVVAFMSALTVIEAGGQAAFMAPTGILAHQHFKTLSALAKDCAIRLEILTGQDKGAARKAKLEALASGEIDLLIGTHALFQKDIVFKDLRFAVIDEQHRFGVKQRLELSQKGRGVDILLMTATPIPRSLALAHYGDMDISILDEKPAGRKPIDTVIISLERLEEIIQRLKSAISEGRQVYWVCPLVEESEVSDLTAAEERVKTLQQRLGEEAVGLVHGRMESEKKDAAMRDFASGKTRILVATTVIEVGVDVPNASIMVIEHAERFGLSQLHQLRGRVGRGDLKSSCILLYGAPLSQTARKRLSVIRETEDGFKIAEEDLRLRGAGDVLGHRQSGLADFRIADLEEHQALLQLARDDARLCLHNDPNLTSEQGQAVRTLLYLMDYDSLIQLISVG